MTLRVGPARRHERLPALRLLFQHVAPDDERNGRIERALALLASGELAPDGLFVCRANGRMAGVFAAMAMPGAAGLVWPPQAVSDGASGAVEDVLIAFGKRWLSQRGVKFAQSLLPQAELAHAQPLLRHGFHHVTTLLHLDKDLTLADRHSDETPRLRCQAFDQCDAGIFKKVLLDSYEKTLDCPELNDLRTADEIIAGYRQMPGCRVEDWYLVWVDGQPVGVLILVPGVEPGAREMAYLGLTLAARGKGLGAAITLWAMDQTRAAGDTRMTLSVDARNAPARRLYAALGFREFESREVILAVLAKP